MTQESLFERYPTYPGSRNTDTSRDAAKDIAPKAEVIRSKIMRMLRVRDMSPDECAAELELNILAVRPRFSELYKLGKIERTDKRALTASKKRAIVWRVV